MAGRDLAMIGIGAITSAVIVAGGYALIGRQEQDSSLSDFIGNWEFQDQGGGVQLVVEDGRVIAGLPNGPQMELKPISNRQLEGNMRVFGAVKPVKIPVSIELSENKQELTLKILPTKLAPGSLPESVQEQFSQDYTFVAQRTNEELEFSQANKARQSEAKTYVGAMNKASQAYYVENAKFTNSIQALGVGINTETENYYYSINILSNTAVQPIGVAKKDRLKSYSGGVFVTSNNITYAILCETEKPSKNPPPAPQLVNDQPQCAPGTVPIR